MERQDRQPAAVLARLNHLTMKRRSSLSSYDPNNQALRNSISKGVKHGDISFISKKPSYKGIDEEVIDMAELKTQEAFDSIRKKFDRLKKETQAKSKSIQKTKEALESAKEEERLYLCKKSEALDLTADLERRTSEARKLLEEKQVQRKSYEHISHRLKSDISYFNDKGLALNVEHRELSKLLKLATSKDSTLNVEAARAQALVDILRREIDNEKSQRETNLNDLVSKIDNIKNTKNEFQIRDNEIREIAERAIQDKDENEKEWRRLLLTNKLVSRFLQNKMHIEMDKFGVIETAFKNIKIATAVQDGPIMVTRYLEKEKIYGRLLDSIAKSEKEIEVLKTDRDELLKERKELEDSISQSDANKKSNNADDDYHTLDHIKERNEKTEVSSSKLSEWLNRQHRKVSLCDPEYSRNKFSRDDLRRNAEVFIDWLVEQVKTLKEVEETVDIVMDVNTKEEEETTTEAEIGESEIDEENDFLNTDRKERIKKGEKFFEKLRKERQEKALESLEQQTKLKFTKLEKDKEKVLKVPIPEPKVQSEE